jgi:hypothetical protein
LIKRDQATALNCSYVERMSGSRFDLRQRRRECPTCGRLVYLNRDGFYRRHFGTQPDGSVRLCATSGHAPRSVVARALRHLDL